MKEILIKVPECQVNSVAQMKWLWVLREGLMPLMKRISYILVILPLGDTLKHTMETKEQRSVTS